MKILLFETLKHVVKTEQATNFTYIDSDCIDFWRKRGKNWKFKSNQKLKNRCKYFPINSPFKSFNVLHWKGKCAIIYDNPVNPAQHSLPSPVNSLFVNALRLFAFHFAQQTKFSITNFQIEISLKLKIDFKFNINNLSRINTTNIEKYDYNLNPGD